ncbi:MAG: N,N-dimethylformamidase large subunit [Alphaproteobacteria bacterium]|nr:N,N-dimethylformamidase large subunit [Alphaproteobacteria bacterium]
MIPLIGYANELAARPGESLGFKVSSVHTTSYDVQLVRIISADPNPDGPGIIHEEVDAVCNGSYPSRFQDYALGSYAVVPLNHAAEHQRLTFAVMVCPFLLDRDRQTLLAIGDPATGTRLELSLDRDGPALVLTRERQTDRICIKTQPRLRHWYRFTATVDFMTGNAKLMFVDARETANVKTVFGRLSSSQPLKLSDMSRITIAAWNGDVAPENLFNGRLEAPRVFSNMEAWDDPFSETLVGRCLAAWDFSDGIDTDKITDIGPNGLHGTLINMPTRGATSTGWRGREMCWRHAPQDYAAIHFHEDDCYDCGWEDDFVFEIPPDLKSGNYAMRLHCGEDTDFVPFFVAAPLGHPRASICVVIPTYTYVMYGNNGRYDYGPAIEQRMKEWGAYPYNPERQSQFSQSSYNLHPDGSGISLCSWRRPLINLRSGYLTLLAPRCGSGLRHYQADSHLWSWLESKGLDFDVVTDHQLERDGPDALKPYQTVLTCTHPEYHTERSLDAFQGYTDHGGNLCYLGGNGFYWRIAVSDTIPGIAEIRRNEGGIRTWATQPGEYYNALDGQYGGLWRRNGRPPQILTGVGFSAQGTFNGSYYRRTQDSYRDDLAWMFEGIDDDTLGDEGLSGSGAAGYELDRYDPLLGSPETAIIVAKSEAHASTYVVAPEEMLTHVSTTTGDPPADLIRSDIVYFNTPSGGAVFSVGSITFCGSLPCNNYDNGISRLLENVVRHFSKL